MYSRARRSLLNPTTLPTRLFTQDLLDQRCTRRLSRLPVSLRGPSSALRLHHLRFPGKQTEAVTTTPTTTWSLTPGLLLHLMS